MAEKIEFVLQERLKSAHGKHNFELGHKVQEVIDSASSGDTIAIKVTVNSPIKIVSAVNITKNPEKLFEVA